MKDRMLHFLIEVGKKHKAKAGLCGVMALLFVMGVFLVLPSFADETGDEPVAETVSEEEFEPTMTPEVTVKPVETEIPDTAEPEETKEPEKTKEPSESEEEEESGEATKEPDPSAAPEVAASKEEEGKEPLEPAPADDGKVPSRPKRAAKAAPVQLPTPTYQIVEEPAGPFSYPLNGTSIKIKIQVTPPEGAGVEYQWYVSHSAGGTGEQLIGHGAQTSAYTIPSNTGAGEYYYYCMIRSVDNDGYNLPSEELRSRDVVVSIAKGEPQIEYFDLSTIKKEYYYTGEVIDPKIVCSKEGMGDAYIVVKDGGIEIRPKAESDDPYSVYLHISEGANYKAKTIDLNRTMTIKRLPSPTGPYTVSGKKGKLVDGIQWYTSEVKLVPKSGFLISATGTDFKDELIYSDEGTNQGPAKNVIYLQNKTNHGITDAITVTEKRDGKINIDLSKPVGTVSYNSESFDGTEHDYNGSYSKDEVVFNLTASDDVSGVASRSYVWAKDVLSERQLASASWKPWVEGDTQVLNTEGTSILYAKVEDKAGNIGYTSTDRITIDKTMPEILCGTKSLGDTKSYFADRKKITVRDTYLKYVTVRRDGTVIQTKSGNDIVAGSTSFRLERPDGVMEDITYEITAEDEAGNEKVTSVTLKNPVLDVDVADLDFGSGDRALVYGYGSVEAQSVSMTNKADGKPVVVDGLELELAEGAESFFEIVDGTKVRPKQRLHVGTYTGAVRIYYNGEAESTTLCRCTVTVQPAPMLVSYTGQSDVGYHTLPDLTGTIEYAQSDFKNGDTKRVFEADPNFVAPKLYYRAEDGTMQEYTSDKRAMESMQLIPDGGSSTDYVFSYRGGDLEVRQHILRNGYVIEGDKVDGYNWYVSNHVAIRPANGFQLSESQDPNSFAAASQLISVAGPTNGEEKSFYVMNNTTGEISALMKENIKIDNTAPYFREGEGITVSSNLWTEFCNTITFGIFFNNTKAVSIRATDEESGLESIRYCVSPVAVDGSVQELETKLDWQEYDDGFSISPDEYERVVIYAKITNHAGLVTYASSDGMVFDNKQPDINKVENGKEQSIIDEKEYITEELSLKVFDHNLEEAILYEGASTSATGSVLTITENPDHSRQAVRNIPCPSKGSKTYTVIARDSADNNAERQFTITKPIYDIVADPLKIDETAYGYGFVPQTPVTWKNTEKANADATVSRVELSNDRDFEVRQSGDQFWIAAKSGLAHGNYTTEVTLVYNGGKRAETTCSFSVSKAILTAVFTGGDAYYHEKLGEKATVKVTGFVRQNGVLETPETAAGYRAPTVQFNGVAEETKELTPAGGKADNYTFHYKSGLLLVERRYAKAGNDGQYTIEGTISDTGWYTSDITIRPKQGFLLSRLEEFGEPLESIVLTEDTDRGSEAFYVMNERTGEIFERSVFDYKKDCAAPVIQGIEPDATYEENSRQVVVEDDNLFCVTVNGKPQTVEHGRTRFNLTADQETMVYVVVATDVAGNMNDMTVVLNQPGSLPAASSSGNDSAVTAEPGTTPALNQGKDGKAGQVKKSVKVVQGAPDTSLTTSTNELKTSVLSNGEQQAVGNGSNANIELRIRNIDSNVPQGDKELVIASLGGYTVGEYLDITLWKKVGSKAASKVSVINSPIAVTVAVPEELRSRSREFVVLRVHKGAVSVLEDQDSATNTVTFETDRFSTYALAYKTTSSGNGTGSSAATGRSGNDGLVDASPETGDTAPILPISITFFATLAGIVTTIVVRRKTDQ